MHVCFIPYGKRELVEKLLRDMESQKFYMPMTKGKETKKIAIDGVLRVMPGGFYEYVFPREALDIVLNTLIRDTEVPYDLNKELKVLGLKINPYKFIKKYLRIEDTPTYKKDNKLLWYLEHISIIILGIRKDGELVEPKGALFEGWTHEAL
jgi:hypothetical protein